MHHIERRFGAGGYTVCIGIADTIGTAWALAHFGARSTRVESCREIEALWNLPPAALRIAPELIARLHKVGLQRIGQFIRMPARTLQRRFGDSLLVRIGQAVGTYPEAIEPIAAEPHPYSERLACVEPVRSAQSIEIALQKLLEKLCIRLSQESKGIRAATLKAYRIDGKIERISIGTGHASHHALHLFKLFSLKICCIEPALGIELFELEADMVEPMHPTQDTFWNKQGQQIQIAELLDNIATRVGQERIKRYLPQEHYLPELSVHETHCLYQRSEVSWNDYLQRPIHLLSCPEPIDVVVPLPDYPPLSFIHRGKVYKIVKADGPERIESEW